MKTRALGVALVASLVVVSTAEAKFVSGHQIPVTATTFKMTGDLLGTWKGLSFKTVKTKPYFYGKGTERFTGCIDQNHDKSCNGDLTGTIDFSFRYWAKTTKKGSVQLGACSHPVTGATGGLTGTTGFLMMVDTPKKSGKGVTTEYQGYLALPGEVPAARPARAHPC